MALLVTHIKCEPPGGMLVYVPLIAHHLSSCCLPQPIQGECARRGGAPLAHSAKLIGCKGLWVEESLGAEVNICVWGACASTDMCVWWWARVGS